VSEEKLLENPIVLSPNGKQPKKKKPKAMTAKIERKK
jgi:hypothetical protein